MPTHGPGLRSDKVATKAVLHGDPVIEQGVPGVAFKNSQLNHFVDPSTAAARTVQIGETFTILVGGKVEARTAVITGGLPAVGAKLYIVEATNLLTTTVGSNVKFGVVDAVNAARGVAIINTNLRDSF